MLEERTLAGLESPGCEVVYRLADKRGRGVVAWDENILRKRLRWRL